jgi:hypothetical protein
MVRLESQAVGAIFTLSRHLLIETFEMTGLPTSFDYGDISNARTARSRCHMTSLDV